MNTVQMIGNLTADPDVQHTRAGVAVCNARVALNRKYKNTAGELIKETAYVDVAVWGPSGENLARYHRKGDPIAISGYLRTDEWVDKTTGEKRSALKVTAFEWYFAGAKKATATADGTPAVGAVDTHPDDDTPF